MTKGEADGEGPEHFASAQAASASILFYELLVIHAEPSTNSSAATVIRSPRRNARTCRSSDHPKHAQFCAAT